MTLDDEIIQAEAEKDAAVDAFFGICKDHPYSKRKLMDAGIEAIKAEEKLRAKLLEYIQMKGM